MCISKEKKPTDFEKYRYQNKLEKNLLKTYVWSVALNTSESWAIGKTEEKTNYIRIVVLQEKKEVF